jgi:uncharacterized protein YyaL (SSP411 family)
MAGNSPVSTGNRLAFEQSPYLLQHASNPVDWMPWGDEAFEHARQLNRPVFVSIGYATCHWCHVMEHESFEHQAVANVLNNHFVAIKVDREERPDVDALYMDVCQAMTGRGGWPLTVLTDADRRPFFAGTYFPRESQHGRMGLLDLLDRILHAWQHDRNRINEQCTSIAEALRNQAAASSFGTIPSTILHQAVEAHRRMYDAQYGGFGSAPKFPSAHHLVLLTRASEVLEGGTEIMEMVTATLDAMRAGGLYDHVGGGFHRYSTDRQWFMPHFEKMLYDQAMLMLAYTEAYRSTGTAFYANVVADIATYLKREMTSPNGAFYSAQDADTLGVEGVTYVWSLDEFTQVAGPAAARLATLFGMTSSGTMHDEATGNATGTNIIACSPAALQTLLNDAEWHAARAALLEHRLKRAQPLTDDKVLCDWNGMMAGALARASVVFRNAEYQEMAVAAFRSVAATAKVDGNWFHGYRKTVLNAQAMLDDHAMLAWAATEIALATGEEQWLDAAREHLDIIVEQFMNDDGALFLTANHIDDVLARQRSDHDGAYPSGASFAVMAMTAYGRSYADARWIERARRAATALGESISKAPYGYSMMVAAWLDVQESIGDPWCRDGVCQRPLPLTESTRVEEA